MANLAFVAPPLLGHLHPMIVLAREAQASNHRVAFVGIEDLRSVIDQAGLQFLPIGQRFPAGELQRIRSNAGKVRGLTNLDPVIRDMARMTDTLCAELPQVLSLQGFEAIVCDQLEPAGGLIAEHMALPHVSVANALLINRDDAVPPFFTAWLPEETRWARRRNRGAHDIADLMQWRHAHVISRWARKWNLGRRRSCNDCLSPQGQVSQIVPGFDFPRDRPPPALEYCGPFRNVVAEAPQTIALGRSGPFVFASMGSLFGGRFDVFQAIAGACQSLGLDLVLTHGGRLDEPQCRALPGSTHAFAEVRQEPLIARAALCLTHAGMNTVLDALSAGVPCIAVPLAFDQPGIAARLVWSGAGERLTTSNLTVDALRETISRVLNDDSYRVSARKLAAELQIAGGARRAVQVIESCLAQRPSAT